MNRTQKVVLAHGLLVMMVGMLAGFMLIFALTGGFEIWPGNILSIPTYGTTEGWVRAHSGGITNGLMVIAIAFTLSHVDFSAAKQKFVGYGFVYIAWAFTGFYWLGNAAGNRALTIGDNPLGESDIYGVLGVLPGLPAVFLVVILLIMVAQALLKKTP